MSSGDALGEATQFSRRVALRIRSEWWVVALGALAGMCCGLVAGLAMPSVYASSAVLYVTSASDGNTQTAYQGTLASQQRVESYARLAKSDAVLSSALRVSGAHLTVDEARASLSTTTTPDTVLITLSASRSTPEEAAVLVNSVANAMTTYVAGLEVPNAGGEPLAKVTVITPGAVQQDPVSPHRNRLVGLGLLAGVALSLLLIYMRARFDTRIRSDRDIGEITSVGVLARIPEEETLSRRRIANFAEGASAASEEFRRLRANLEFSKVDSPARIITVTSSNAGEGKTTVAANLAVALSEGGARVVIVDADLRKPTVAEWFNLPSGVGFTEFLSGRSDLADVVQESGVPNLDILASGQVPPNPAELVASKRAELGVRELGVNYDYVIIDSPPILPVADSLVLAEVSDGVIVVARVDEVRRDELSESLARLGRIDVAVLGVVCNGGVGRSDRYGIYGHGYHGPSELSDSMK